MSVAMDYSGQLADLIEKQQAIIDNQEQLITELQNQTSILLEQVNGFTLIVNYLHSIVGISICVIGVVILWQILTKWFFRGV